MAQRRPKVIGKHTNDALASTGVIEPLAEYSKDCYAELHAWRC